MKPFKACLLLPYYRGYRTINQSFFRKRGTSVFSVLCVKDMDCWGSSGNCSCLTPIPWFPGCQGPELRGGVVSFRHFRADQGKRCDRKVAVVHTSLICPHFDRFACGRSPSQRDLSEVNCVGATAQRRGWQERWERGLKSLGDVIEQHSGESRGYRAPKDSSFLGSYSYRFILPMASRFEVQRGGVFLVGSL